MPRSSNPHHSLNGLLIIVLACLLAACGVKRPKSVISEKRMEDVLYDYHIARALGEELSKSEPHKRVLYANAVFDKHGITEAEFDSSMVWYARHPDVLSEIYERVSERLKAQRDAINRLMTLKNQQPGETLPGDSIDVWPWQRTYRLTGQPLDNKRTFTLASDSNYYDRDTLTWSACFRLYEKPDSALAPIMALQIAYTNDSVVAGHRRIVADGTYTITLQADTFGDIREVRGFIFTPSTGRSYGIGLRADAISLMRYHAQDSLVLPEVDITEQEETTPAKTAEQNADEAEKTSTKKAVKRTVPRPQPHANANDSGDKSSSSPTKNSALSPTKKQSTPKNTQNKKTTNSTNKKTNSVKKTTKPSSTTSSKSALEQTKISVEEQNADQPLEE